MAENKKSKYVLFKGDGPGAKPCAFFALPEGCKNGDRCIFMHGSSGNSETETKTSKVQPERVAKEQYIEQEYAPLAVESRAKKEKIPTSTFYPSSKEVELQEKIRLLEQQNEKLLSKQQNTAPVAKMAPPKPAALKKEPIPAVTIKKVNSRPKVPASLESVGTTRGVSPAGVKTSITNVSRLPTNAITNLPKTSVTLDESGNESVSDDDAASDHAFLIGVVDQALKGGQSSEPNSPYLHKADLVNVIKKRKVQSNTFLESAEVSKRLATSGTRMASKFKEISTNKQLEPSTESYKSMHQTPVSTNITDDAWQELVARTKESARFKSEYTFKKDSSWIQAKEAGVWSRQLPKLIAIDCEMCITQDPLTKEKDSFSLIRFSAVNGQKPSEVLVDTLVVPMFPIVDCKTNIHGILEEQIKAVNFSLRHAQAFLYGICSSDTIVIGHAVHNDLKALKFEHTRVIDTAYLYSLAGEPSASASLRDISDQILGVKLPNIHDSVLDSRAALQAAAFAASNPNIPQIVRSKESLNCLLFHRLPDDLTSQHIQEMIIAQTQIVPLDLQMIANEQGNRGEHPINKCIVSFLTQQHADLAFDSIAGLLKEDKAKRAQKRVYLANGGQGAHIYVRKY